ncbi:hypothetical protein SGFS_045100 [Streptomyces graminofaciens]|uniref:Uncharacterized protein n=1 Tax=Streptomyces graminofaciens TaxID=68212 RepID=A0ABM7FB19_9ACTN|nr:hypothetical protein [Streptomyces graminofaciens]BBC33216.1 hypothetical protein SGFS_045100 [Streptomyces graminofaciens]
MQKMKTMGIATVTGLVLASGTVVVAAPASADERCDPYVTRSYKQTKADWLTVGGKLVGVRGTIDNRKSSAAVTETVSVKVGGTLKASYTGELSGGVNILIAEVNAKTSYTVEVSATIEVGKKVSVKVPAHKRVSYRTGILKRQFRVTQKRVTSNCKTITTYGKLKSADPWSSVKNV